MARMDHDRDTCVHCLHMDLYRARCHPSNLERQALRRRLRTAVYGMPLLYAALFLSLYFPPQLVPPLLKFIMVITYMLVIATQSYALLTMPL